MFVRHYKDAVNSERRVTSDNWESVRMILKGDEMGFSMHVTTIYAGTTTRICYLNHLEAVLCIEGEGEIEEIANGKVHKIEPGMLYALDNHDEHFLRAIKEMKLVCVFNPPVVGTEVHDENGAYPASA